MERYKLNQWLVVADGNDLAMFTELNCDEETAMAIAVATFGANVTKLVDEGVCRQSLTAAQLHVANFQNCETCGMYKTHDIGCPFNDDSARVDASEGGK